MNRVFTMGILVACSAHALPLEGQESSGDGDPSETPAEPQSAGLRWRLGAESAHECVDGDALLEGLRLRLGPESADGETWSVSWHVDPSGDVFSVEVSLRSPAGEEAGTRTIRGACNELGDALVLVITTALCPTCPPPEPEPAEVEALPEEGAIALAEPEADEPEADEPVEVVSAPQEQVAEPPALGSGVEVALSGGIRLGLLPGVTPVVGGRLEWIPHPRMSLGFEAEGLLRGQVESGLGGASFWALAAGIHVCAGRFAETGRIAACFGWKVAMLRARGEEFPSISQATRPETWPEASVRGGYQGAHVGVRVGAGIGVSVVRDDYFVQAGALRISLHRAAAVNARFHVEVVFR